MTSAPLGSGHSEMDSNSPGAPGNDQDAMKLGLVIGLPIAVVFLITFIVLIVLWKKGKLKKSQCGTVRRRDKEIDAQREEKKRSIVVVAPKGKKGAELYIARHLYEAEDENQLSLQTGRIVEVQEKLDNGWWRGVTGDQEGWFPGAFVRKIDVSDPNCSLPRSLNSTIENRRKRLPAPTTRAPLQQTDSDVCYTNTGFVPPDVSSSLGKLENEEEQLNDDYAGENESDSRFNSMENVDIEGFLNEIFTVEDEVTPEIPRKTDKIKHQTDFNPKKIKNEQNTKMLQENQQNKNKSEKNVNGKLKPGRPKSSPLINPMHYMISSSESLISTDSTHDELDKTDKEQCRIPNKTGEIVDVYRGTPDGSSLQGVLPDGHREFTLEKDTGNDGDLDTTDDSVHLQDNEEENVYEKLSVPDHHTLATNLKDQLNHRESVLQKRLMYVTMYPFTSDDPNQLTLCRNEVLYSLGNAENGWMKGEKKSSGDIGWFPLTYVREASPPTDFASEESEEFDSDGEFEDDENQTGLEFVALYPFTAQQEGDLTLKLGDTIIVTERLETGWWRGCLGDQDGWFPGSYVEAVPQTPASTELYEEIGCPFKMSLPLSTSSPIDKEMTDKGCLDDQAISQSHQNVISAPSKPDTEMSPGGKQKKKSLVPLTFKPHVPRRFITPKLVKLPKRKRSHCSKKKPNRPPPPVPKDPKGDEIKTNGQGSEESTSNFNGKRRLSVPRPIVPPPPTPDPLLKDVVESSGNIMTDDGSGDHYDDEPPAPVSSVPDLDYDDVAVTIPQYYSSNRQKYSQFDSGMELENTGPSVDTISLPEVHTSARFEAKTHLARMSMQECMADSMLTNNTTRVTEMSSQSFGALMDIFEKIVGKNSNGAINTTKNEPTPDISDEVENKFKQTLSEPNLGIVKQPLGKSALDVISEENKGILSSQVSKETGFSHTNVGQNKSGAKKPSLPPRPKLPPQRSKSLGSLALVRSVHTVDITDESVNADNATRNRSNEKPHLKVKPPKPALPAVLLNGNANKKVKSGLQNTSEMVHTGYSEKLIGNGNDINCDNDNAHRHAELIANGNMFRTMVTEPLTKKEIISKQNKPFSIGHNVKSEENVPAEDYYRYNRPTVLQCVPSPSKEHSEDNNILGCLSAQHTSIGLSSKINDSDLKSSNDKIQIEHSPRQNIISNGSLRLGMKVDQSYHSDNDKDVSGENHRSSLNVSKLSDVPPPLPSCPPPSETPPSLSPVSSRNLFGVPRSSQSVNTVGRVVSPINIRTSPLRFFMPTGYSRSGSISSISSNNTTSPTALSPAGTMERKTPNAGHLVNNKSNLTATFDRHLDDNVRRAVSPVSPIRSPTSTTKYNPLHFFTPTAYVSPKHESRVTVEPDPDPAHFTQSEQHLASDSVDHYEKYGSTGSLNYSSTRLYHPYASVEVKSPIRRTLTPPRPFIPATWSSPRKTDSLLMATVDIDIETGDDLQRPSGDDIHVQKNDSHGYILDGKVLISDRLQSDDLPHLKLPKYPELESDV